MHVILKFLNFYVVVWDFVFKTDSVFLSESNKNVLIVCALDFAIATLIISIN